MNFTNFVTLDTASITITSNTHPAITTSVTGFPLTDATSIARNAGFNTSQLTWTTGGDQLWALENSTHNVFSGAITHNQKSIIRTVAGAGLLSFDWSVDSEPEYDHLRVYVNGVEHSKIAGNIAFTRKSILLTNSSNIVVWSYEKDNADSAGQDKAYLRSVNFVGSSASEESGSSLSWFTLLLLPVAYIRRKYRLNKNR